MLAKIFGIALVLAAASGRYVDLESSLFTPVSTAGCYWSGTSPFCAGECGPGEQTCAESDCGDGACCINGIKKYCCPGGCPALPAVQLDTKLHRQPEFKGAEKHSSPSVASPICNWRGTAPFCNGECFGTEFNCGTSGCGDGACCVSGSKVYCCTEGCPNSLDRNYIFAKTETTKKGGDEVDLCDDDEFICCAPDAGVNEECKCIKRDAKKRVSQANQFPFPNGKNDDLCDDDETLCCNPDAYSNKECGCIDESSWSRSRKTDL